MGVFPRIKISVVFGNFKLPIRYPPKPLYINTFISLFHYFDRPDWLFSRTLGNFVFNHVRNLHPTPAAVNHLFSINGNNFYYCNYVRRGPRMFT